VWQAEIRALPLRLREIIKEEQEKCVRISECSSRFVDDLLKDMNIGARLETSVIPHEVSVEVDAFIWHSSKEDSILNRTNYLKYLLRVLELESSCHFHLLDFTSQELVLGRNITGTTDVVVSSTNNEEYILNNAHIIFELQEPLESKEKAQANRT
jgi:hypothetical protein